MATVTVSPKYQIVIPREVRDAAHIKPGAKMEVILYDGQIHLVPLTPLGSLYGSLKGINTSIERDEDRF